MDRPARRLLPALALVATAVLAGCADEEQSPRTADGTTSATPTVAPTAVPAADGSVTTGGPVLVLDQGDMPVVCLGAVADSAPPQCDGQRLAEWDWEEHPEHEARGGVRWGDFALTGTWDGKELEVTDAVPAAEYDGPPPVEEPPGTPCQEPAGGWQAEDPSKVSTAALDETLRRAGQLPGYAESWVDAEDATRPEDGVVNVRVTSAVEAAEAKLRRTWGGPLCVQRARFDEETLVELTTALQELPGVLDTSAWGDVVMMTVVHDDGSLQEWVDLEHGEGRIEVRSVLVPADD